MAGSRKPCSHPGSSAVSRWWRSARVTSASERRAITTSLPGPRSTASATSAVVRPSSQGVSCGSAGTWMQVGRPATAGWSSSAKKNTPQTIRVSSPASPKTASTSGERSASAIEEYGLARECWLEHIVCASARGRMTRSPGPSAYVVPSSTTRCGCPATTMCTPRSGPSNRSRQSPRRSSERYVALSSRSSRSTWLSRSSWLSTFSGLAGTDDEEERTLTHGASLHRCLASNHEHRDPQPDHRPRP